MKLFLIIASLGLLFSCSSKADKPDSSTITSIQIIDKNGFSETISSKERLSLYQKVDFLTPQSYQKVMRVFPRNKEGKTISKITAYHTNGQIKQYLDVVEGRANGHYREWHPNGKLKLEISVIEGTGDLHEQAQDSWLFDGESSVWDENGNLCAKFHYEKGELHGTSHHFYPSGALWKKIPYTHHEVDGAMQVLHESGAILEEMIYRKGIQEGESFGKWEDLSPNYQETYAAGKLMQAHYFNRKGELVGEIQQGNGSRAEFEAESLYSLIEYRSGVAEGLVKLFSRDGSLLSTHFVKEGMKHGEELHYYPQTSQPKLSLMWSDDILQGTVTTWYVNGARESQREIQSNKKKGLSFAWYKQGDLMLMEEYDQDVLMKGSYFKKGEKEPTSSVENGNGVATLFDAEGHFLKKALYEKGRPVLQ